MKDNLFTNILSNHLEGDFMELIFDTSVPIKEFYTTNLKDWLLKVKKANLFEENNKDPYNLFYGIILKKTKAHFDNFHLNKLNIDTLFISLVNWYTDSNSENSFENLEFNFKSLFNLSSVTQISFLYDIENNPKEETPVNLYSFLISLRILKDFCFINKINVGLTDLFFQFFDENRLKKLKSDIFHLDLFLCYLSILITFFYDRSFDQDRTSPQAESIQLTLLTFKNMPDLIENYSFNSIIFSNFKEYLDEIPEDSFILTLDKLIFSKVELILLADNKKENFLLNLLLSKKMVENVEIYTNNKLIINNFKENKFKISSSLKNLTIKYVTKENEILDFSYFFKIKNIKALGFEGKSINFENSIQDSNQNLTKYSHITYFSLKTEELYRLDFLASLQFLRFINLQCLSSNNLIDLLKIISNMKHLKDVNLQFNFESESDLNNKKEAKNIKDLLLSINQIERIEKLNIVIESKNSLKEKHLALYYIALVFNIKSLNYFSLTHKSDTKESTNTKTESYSDIIDKKYQNQMDKFETIKKENYGQECYLVIDNLREHSSSSFDFEEQKQIKNRINWNNFEDILISIYLGKKNIFKLKRGPILQVLFKYIATLSNRTFIVENITK